MTNDFNKGVDYTKEWLTDKLIDIKDEPLIKYVLSILKTIPKKCDFCIKPCGNNWCSTKEENE